PRSLPLSHLFPYTTLFRSNFSFYNGNTSEDVFTIQNSAVDNGRTGSGGWAAYYMPASEGGRGDAPFSQSLINAFESEPGDARFKDRKSTRLNSSHVKISYA